VAFALTYHFMLGKPLLAANRFPTLWRSLHILSGVSPMLPQVLFLVGIYGWFWFSLQGLALFGLDRPLLPSKDSLPILEGRSRMPMFSREDAGDEIEKTARPLTRSYLRYSVVIFALMVVIILVALRGQTLGSLGEWRFGAMILVYLSLCL